MFDILRIKCIAFGQLSQADDCESLISEQDNSEKLQKPKAVISIKLCLLAIATTVAVTAPLGVWIGIRWFRNPDLFCTEHLSEYCRDVNEIGSPTTDRLDSAGVKGRGYSIPSGPIQWLVVERKCLPTEGWA